MKYITTKKSMLSKITVLALMLTTSAYTFTNDHSETKVDNIINVFIPTEKNLAGFFNSSVKTSYNTFVVELDTILRDFHRKIDATTRSHNDDLSIAVDELVDYVAQHFNILLTVFKKYNGKPDTQALAFASEIKREFNTEKIFGEMVCRLKALKIKAADNKRLVKKIDYLMQLIQKKKSEWSTKPDPILFAGLAARMRCQ